MSKFSLLALAILVILIFMAPVFFRGLSLKFQGDKLVKQDKLAEALLHYQEAKKIFPLLFGLSAKIRSTKLLLDSELEYGRIEEIYSETQAIPAVSEPELHRALKLGEIFVPILMYHHIRVNPRPYDPVWAALNVTAEQLDAQLNYLVTNNYHVISLDDLQKALTNGLKLPENPVVLTFDDGYENFYTTAYPILKKYNLRATIFVITQGVANNTAYLTWPQIVEMHKSGLITIGAHTQHHANLPDLTSTLIQNEIIGSRDDIKNHIGESPRWFAYPYGSYNNFAIETVRKAGFSGAVSTIYSSIQSKDRLFLLPRIMIDGRFTINEFAIRLQK